jgi:transposase
MVYVGDDWAEEHHDVELVDDQGRRLARARLPEGLDGITRLHALIAEHLPAEWADLDPAEAAGRVKIGIETDRGPWVQALVAAGYRVYPINPMSVARYRERHSTWGRSPTPPTRTCWPRSCALTTSTTVRSPATASRPRR